MRPRLRMRTSKPPAVDYSKAYGDDEDEKKYALDQVQRINAALVLREQIGGAGKRSPACSEPNRQAQGGRRDPRPEPRGCDPASFRDCPAASRGRDGRRNEILHMTDCEPL
jgi:hypothetical protein